MKTALFRRAVFSPLVSSFLFVSCVSSTPTDVSDNSTGTEPAMVPYLSNDSWPLFRGDAQATGVAKSDLPEKLELLWRFTPPKGGFESTAVIAEGIVYVGGLDG
ncbi:MAG: hypothetical protein ABSA77_03150, partial [Thermoguttaceae bacterium]